MKRNPCRGAWSVCSCYMLWPLFHNRLHGSCSTPVPWDLGRISCKGPACRGDRRGAEWAEAGAQHGKRADVSGWISVFCSLHYLPLWYWCKSFGTGVDIFPCEVHMVVHYWFNLQGFLMFQWKRKAPWKKECWIWIILGLAMPYTV